MEYPRSFGDEEFPYLSRSPALSPRITPAPSSPPRSVYPANDVSTMSELRKTSEVFYDDRSVLEVDQSSLYDQPNEERVPILGIPLTAQSEDAITHESIDISGSASNSESRPASGAESPPLVHAPFSTNSGAIGFTAVRPYSTLTDPQDEHHFAGFQPTLEPGPELTHGDHNLHLQNLQQAMTSLPQPDVESNFIDISSRSQVNTGFGSTEDDKIQPITQLTIPYNDAAVAAVLHSATREQQILGVHTITMQALLGDTEGLQATSSRRSDALHGGDGAFRSRPIAKPLKRVNVMPPPIDVHSKNHIPEDIVRTPYPTQARESRRQQPSPLGTIVSAHLSKTLPLGVAYQGRYQDSMSFSKVVVVGIPVIDDTARRNLGTATSREKERHFRSLDYDDAHLFRDLRKAYHKLTRRCQCLSARTLRQITIRYAPTKYSSCKVCTSSSNRETEFRPKTMNSAGNQRMPQCHIHGNDIGFAHYGDLAHSSELLKLFRRPKLCKGRHAWVDWVHRVSLSSQPTSSDEIVEETRQTYNNPKVQTYEPARGEKARSLLGIGGPSLAGRRTTLTSTPDPQAVLPGSNPWDGQSEFDGTTIVFVHGWSTHKILAAVVFVIVLSLAGTILWIFLGPTSSLDLDNAFDRSVLVAQNGVHGASSRVGQGLLIGGLVLGFGWTLVATWLGASWILG